MTKKLASMFLALAMCLSLAAPVWAVEESSEADLLQSVSDFLDNSPTTQTIEVTEGEMVAQMLEDHEISRADLNNELLTLSLLPKKELEDMGYGEEQVNVIKKYNEGEDAFTHLYGSRSTAATNATLRFRYGVAGTTNTKKTVQIAYDMSWSQRPVSTYADAFFVGWTAADSTSNPVVTKIDSASASVDYHTNDGNYPTSESLDLEIYPNYLIGKPLIGPNYVRYAYHISGLAMVTSQSESYNMASLTVYIRYAHTVKSLSVDSVGFSIDTGGGASFSISLKNEEKQEMIVQGYTPYMYSDYNAGWIPEASGTE